MRRHLSLRGRMVATAVVAAGLALGVLLLVTGPSLETRARHDAEATLLAEARLMARVVEDSLARGIGPDALDPVVDDAAREVNARVTIVAPDGRVLADSALSGEALLAMENHGQRPEVKAALAGQATSILRHSATVGADLLYAAVPVRSTGRVVGVARVSRGIDAITDQGRQLWWSAALALALALLATALLSLLLSASLGRTLNELMDGARRLAQGDLSARLPARRDDELGELAHILSHSAAQLQQQLAEIARDRGRTEAVLSALEDGVLAVDHRGVVVLANARLAGALPLTQPIGRHYLEVVRQREVGELVERVLRTGERATAEVELLNVGRVFTITALPFPGAEGTPHGAVLTFNDATERRRVERMRRDFVANASHELRTPLTSIRGFVEALEDDAVDDPEKARRFLGKIRVHAERMTTLVQDLLELSRLDSGTREPDWEEVNPAAVAVEVIGTFAAPAAAKQIALRHVDRCAATVLTDRDRLRRILENLVDNAVKYTPAGGHVELATSPGDEGAVRIEVTDDGPGIAAEHLDRVFERFYRVDKARSRELGGTGLGLSIVRHLADSVGAAVTVASTPARGACFRVTLPARPAAAEATVDSE
ncbi:MAG TPA: ATP-binding protein [Vicinamibacteria bacterium]|nr:ATP-binding protein [Vicinamibacteria bacterium]